MERIPEGHQYILYSISMKNFFYYIALIDTEEIKRFGKYELFLISASFTRQVLSTLFSFCVLLYGTSIILPLWYSIVISMVIVLILFSIDQAIIGSEWSLYKIYVKNKFVNFFTNVILIPLRIMPRICYSIIIAYGIATIAEIRIQHRAIDKILNTESKQFNNEYLAKTEEKERDIERKESEKKKNIAQLEEVLNSKRNALNSKKNIALSLKEKNDLDNDIIHYRDNISENQKKIMDLSEEISIIQAKVDANNEEIRLKEIEMDHEANDKDRGAKKGPRWKAFNREVIALKTQNSNNIPYLQSKRNEMQRIAALIEKNKKYLSELEKRSKELASKTEKKQYDTRTVEEISSELEKERNELNKLMKSNEIYLANYKQTLENGGFYQKNNYGPLDRYIGLKKLYNDPEYGTAAKEFSYGLKITIILLELSPVMVMLFFSPYSFYSTRMREKMERDRKRSELPDKENIFDEVDQAEQRNILLKKIRDIEKENAEIEKDIETNRRVHK
ncbi:MAG: DUF4407 domain-containing protein [Candidatus Electrothrix scaldis]|nr:MAG: DUF4407 domain-containing protein [Candidatus Electrothrix sp. GW3-3]